MLQQLVADYRCRRRGRSRKGPTPDHLQCVWFQVSFHPLRLLSIGPSIQQLLNSITKRFSLSECFGSTGKLVTYIARSTRRKGDAAILDGYVYSHLQIAMGLRTNNCIRHAITVDGDPDGPRLFFHLNAHRQRIHGYPTLPFSWHIWVHRLRY
jgi:hypothetical protein